jgi:hypothetical protein
LALGEQYIGLGGAVHWLRGSSILAQYIGLGGAAHWLSILHLLKGSECSVQGVVLWVRGSCTLEWGIVGENLMC